LATPRPLSLLIGPWRSRLSPQVSHTPPSEVSQGQVRRAHPRPAVLPRERFDGSCLGRQPLLSYRKRRAERLVNLPVAVWAPHFAGVIPWSLFVSHRLAPSVPSPVIESLMLSGGATPAPAFGTSAGRRSPLDSPAGPAAAGQARGPLDCVGLVSHDILLSHPTKRKAASSRRVAALAQHPFTITTAAQHP
jgi:hypothetical protein